ncbi:MAG: rod shape-determining protein MreD [Ruminococcus sp.]|nr:rod shape-determining protein MreD [Ruminococcus sp.]
MKLKIIRYAAYSLEIILLLVLQGTPGLIPEVFGGKPILLVSFALSIAAVEEVVPSLVFAAVCGALADISAGGTIGFFAVSLTLLCYALCCLTRYYFSGGAAIAVVLCLAATVLILGARFLLFALPQGGAELFVSHYISRMIYTFAATVPLYFLNRFLSDALK